MNKEDIFRFLAGLVLFFVLLAAAISAALLFSPLIFVGAVSFLALFLIGLVLLGVVAFLALIWYLLRKEEPGKKKNSKYSLKQGKEV